MKKYKCKFLTEKGIIEMIISEDQNIEAIETELTKQYGKFITLSSTEIN